MHGISVWAISDDLVLRLLLLNTLKSDKTNRCISNEICQQIININYKKTSKKSIFFIMDWWTVNHAKCLAVGYLFRAIDEVNFQVLGILVFEKATSEKNKAEVIKISSIDDNNCHGKIVGCCTDNASNFKKVFLDLEERNADFVPINVLRISWICYTVQLTLKNLKKNDSYQCKLLKITEWLIKILKDNRKLNIDNLTKLIDNNVEYIYTLKHISSSLPSTCYELLIKII